MSIYFLGYKPGKYQCLLPNCNQYTSSYDAEQSHIYLSNSTALNRTRDLNMPQCEIKPTIDWKNKHMENCNKIGLDVTAEYIICDVQHFDIVYDSFTMNSTIVTEFKLFCNNEYKVKHVISYLIFFKVCKV